MEGMAEKDRPVSGPYGGLPPPSSRRGRCRHRPLHGGTICGRGQARSYVPAPSSGFLPYRPVRRGRYGVSPRRRCAIGRTTWGRFQRWGPEGPLFGRFKGDGCREGGKSKSPLPGWLFRPFLATQKGARRRHDKNPGVKKGNMEGASARNKAGRCGHRPLRGGALRWPWRSPAGGHKGRPYRAATVNAPMGGKRGRPGASAPTLGGCPPQRITA